MREFACMMFAIGIGGTIACLLWILILTVPDLFKKRP